MSTARARANNIMHRHVAFKQQQQQQRHAQQNPTPHPPSIPALVLPSLSHSPTTATCRKRKADDDSDDAPPPPPAPPLRTKTILAEPLFLPLPASPLDRGAQASSQPPPVMKKPLVIGSGLRVNQRRAHPPSTVKKDDYPVTAASLLPTLTCEGVTFAFRPYVPKKMLEIAKTADAADGISAYALPHNNGFAHPTPSRLPPCALGWPGSSALDSDSKEVHAANRNKKDADDAAAAAAAAAIVPVGDVLLPPASETLRVQAEAVPGAEWPPLLGDDAELQEHCPDWATLCQPRTWSDIHMPHSTELLTQWSRTLRTFGAVAIWGGAGIGKRTMAQCLLRSMGYAPTVLHLCDEPARVILDRLVGQAMAHHGASLPLVSADSHHLPPCGADTHVPVVGGPSWLTTAWLRRHFPPAYVLEDMERMPQPAAVTAIIQWLLRRRIPVIVCCDNVYDPHLKRALAEVIRYPDALLRGPVWSPTAMAGQVKRCLERHSKRHGSADETPCINRWPNVSDAVWMEMVQLAAVDARGHWQQLWTQVQMRHHGFLCDLGTPNSRVGVWYAIANRFIEGPSHFGGCKTRTSDMWDKTDEVARQACGSMEELCVAVVHQSLPLACQRGPVTQTFLSYNRALDAVVDLDCMARWVDGGSERRVPAEWTSWYAAAGALRVPREHWGQTESATGDHTFDDPVQFPSVLRVQPAPEMRAFFDAQAHPLGTISAARTDVGGALGVLGLYAARLKFSPMVDDIPYVYRTAAKHYIEHIVGDVGGGTSGRGRGGGMNGDAGGRSTGGDLSHTMRPVSAMTMIEWQTMWTRDKTDSALLVPLFVRALDLHVPQWPATKIDFPQHWDDAVKLLRQVFERAHVNVLGGLRASADAITGYMVREVQDQLMALARKDSVGECIMNHLEVFATDTRAWASAAIHSYRSGKAHSAAASALCRPVRLWDDDAQAYLCSLVAKNV